MSHRLIKASQAQFIGMSCENYNWGWRCPNTNEIIDIGLTSSTTAVLKDKSIIIKVRCPCCQQQHGAPVRELGVLMNERLLLAVGNVKG